MIATGIDFNFPQCSKMSASSSNVEEGRQERAPPHPRGSQGYGGQAGPLPNGERENAAPDRRAPIDSELLRSSGPSYV